MNNSSFKIGMILMTVKKPMICTSFGTFEASHAPIKISRNIHSKIDTLLG